MISVTRQPEPSTFHAKVRAPGEIFLKSRNYQPSSADFKKLANQYWRSCLPELQSSYRSICAYTALPITTQGSVDHYQPKSLFPRVAYEWSNFRFCMNRVNSYKGQSQDVLDPFVIRTDWFHLDLATLLIYANPALQKLISDRVDRTLKILKLNDDEVFVDLRFDAYSHYLRGDWTLEYLTAYYPFIAHEVVRQDQAAIKSR